MQERYCSCGMSVWVQYKSGEALRAVRFWSLSLLAGERLDRCRFCGRRLDIDSLR